MFKAAKLRQYFGIDKKSSPTKWYTKRPKSAENQPHTPNVNRFVYISPCLNFISDVKMLSMLSKRFCMCSIGPVLSFRAKRRICVHPRLPE